MKTYLLVVACALVLVGCGPSSVLNEWNRAELNDTADLQEWSAGSAPQVYGSILLITSALVTASDEQSAEGCPVKSVEGDNTTYTGDCTDSRGYTWSGKAVVSSDADTEDGSGSYRFEGFGMTGEAVCGAEQSATEQLEINGTVVSEATGEPGELRFNYDLRIDQTAVDDSDCSLQTERIAYSYSGTVVESGERRTWNGSGRFGLESRGTMEVSTVDEVTNTSECLREALSGTTTLKAKDTTAVITYDGATDCSDQSTVTWTLDGEEMGVAAGITCAAASGAPWGLALLGLLGLGVLRRRS